MSDNVSLALNGMRVTWADEPDLTITEMSTTWTPVISKDGCPGYRVERDGKKLYVFLNLSSNEPTAWLYMGTTMDLDGDIYPCHFYNLEEEFT